ncbi:MarR family winged helix-turn-helix transcriptional regulator [Liquorilactobacillus sicerae]|uniref:MarR family winged helix-turn-helix transcriptional regulator n=1 Tax=Liquorilactobacillus sicerae TaxID=1416943 RepID=UPI0024808279|nr:MarR family transcriptional regulator [Liquorilactobacillus sicerae]
MIDDFCLQRQLIKLGNQLSNRRQADLLAHDLTASQSEILLYFADHPGHLVSHLKNHLRVSHQAAQKLVMKLRQRQLLMIKVDPTDARQHQIYLTKAGKLLVQELKQHGTFAGQELLAALTEQQKDQLAHLISLLLQSKK